MTGKFHGIFSIALAGIAIVLGAYSIIRLSLVVGLLYCILTVMSFLLIVYSYCCKCTCRKHSCGHVIFGKIAEYLPSRKQEKYSYIDIFGVIIALLFIIGFPQYWLVRQISILFIFWGLLIVAGIEIFLFVCATCQNERCSLCRGCKTST